MKHSETLLISKLIDDSIERCIEEERKKHHRSHDIKPIWQSYIDGTEERVITEGEDMLSNIEKSFEKLEKMKPYSYFQKIAVNSMLLAFMRKILGNDIYKCINRVMKKYGVDELPQDIVLDMPRKNGKTFIVGQFIGNIMYNRPGTEIFVYSITRRNSERVTQEANEALMQLKEPSDNIEITMSSNALKVYKDGKVSVAYSCQGKNIDIDENTRISLFNIKCTYTKSIITIIFLKFTQTQTRTHTHTHIQLNYIHIHL